MTRKDFVNLANCLRGVELSEEVKYAILRFCRGQNPNFNEFRWLSYLRGECGPVGGQLKNEG